MKMHKTQVKKITPILANKPENYFIELPSGKFSKFLAISLKNAFNLIAVESEGDLKVSPMQLAGNLNKITEISKFSTVLEDLAILHDKVNFKEIVEILCSDASEEQIETVLEWVKEWESTKGRKNKSCLRSFNYLGRKTS